MAKLDDAATTIHQEHPHAALVRYDAMCSAIAEAHAVDEVKDVRDKAAALQYYARQANNPVAERQFYEIRERAERKSGELLAEREMHGGDRRSESRSDVTTLKGLGITKQQSSDWQRLAQVPVEKFEAALQEPTIDGMRGALRDALVETLGPPPDRTHVTAFRRKSDPAEDALSDLGVAISTLASLQEPDMAKLAALVQAELIDWHLRLGREALARLQCFITALQTGGQHAA